MATFTLKNHTLGLTVTVQAADKYRAKCLASKVHRAMYPDIKGSLNSPFYWSVA